jgi:hypothetical protein
MNNSMASTLMTDLRLEHQLHQLTARVEQQATQFESRMQEATKEHNTKLTAMSTRLVASELECARLKALFTQLKPQSSSIAADVQMQLLRHEALLRFHVLKDSNAGVYGQAAAAAMVAIPDLHEQSQALHVLPTTTMAPPNGLANKIAAAALAAAAATRAVAARQNGTVASAPKDDATTACAPVAFTIGKPASRTFWM